MERRVSSVLSILASFALLLSALFVSPARSVTAIHLDPSTTAFDTSTTPVGSKFNVTAWVTDVSDLFAYQVRVYYDPTMINASRAWLPTWSTQWVFYGKTTVRLNPILKSNYTQVGDVMYIGTTFIGSGQLAIFEFQVIKSPPKTGQLSCTLDIDNDGTYLIDSSGTNDIPALKTNGSYTYTWVPPPRPHLAVTPTYVRQPNVSFAFNVGVYIMALDAGWQLTNATLTLAYNSTVINVLGGAANVSIPSNWLGTNEVSITRGMLDTVNITVRNPEVAGGDLLVASIKFTVMSQGGTSLIITSCRLFDHIVEIPTNPPVNGFVSAQELFSDIAIQDARLSKTIVGQGLNVVINVTVANNGDYDETFNVTAYGNTSAIQTILVSLPAGNATTISFMWNTTGYPKGNYMISANAEPALDDANATNNAFTAGWMTIAMIGDITGVSSGVPDGKVDIRDIAAVATGFGSSIGQPRYVSNSDLNSDGKIDIKDLALAAKNYGKIDP